MRRNGAGPCITGPTLALPSHQIDHQAPSEHPPTPRRRGPAVRGLRPCALRATPSDGSERPSDDSQRPALARLTAQ
jgi:hypothetical protein